MGFIQKRLCCSNIYDVNVTMKNWRRSKIYNNRQNPDSFKSGFCFFKCGALKKYDDKMEDTIKTSKLKVLTLNN